MAIIYAISGDGTGAGKSTLARRLAEGRVYSLAGALRAELKRLYPAYDWFNSTQTYKENTRVKECDNRTVRDVLIKHGQDRCFNDPTYYARILGDQLKNEFDAASVDHTVAIDDVRKICELDYFRERYGNCLIHLHLTTPSAVPEIHFENDELKKRADYLIQWRTE